MKRYDSTISKWTFLIVSRAGWVNGKCYRVQYLHGYHKGKDIWFAIPSAQENMESRALHLIRDHRRRRVLLGQAPTTEPSSFTG